MTVVRGRDIGGSRGERPVCPYVVVQVEQQLYKTQVREGTNAPALMTLDTLKETKLKKKSSP